MNIKKITAAVMAAAVVLSIIPQTVSATSEETERKYRCEWVDVRPDSQYGLTVETVEKEGEQKCLVRLSGIPETVMDYSDDFSFSMDDGYSYTRSLTHVSAIVDIDGGKKYLLFEGSHDLNESASCYFVDLTKLFVEVVPDENGEYCYYETAYSAKLRATMSAGTRAVFTRTSDGKLCFECYLDVDNIYAKYLAEAETTTVAVYDDFRIDYGYGLGAGSGGTDFGIIGFLSDGTAIKGDGKYIDCDTGEVIEGYDSLAAFSKEVVQKLEIVDSDTDLPKEIVKIVKDDSMKPSEPDVPENKVIDYIDSSTNISASADEGVIPDDAELSVTPVDSESTESRYAYDIKFIKDGKEVQPDGTVTVKIPVPESLKGKTVNVYHIENGKYINMNAKADGDFVSFTTDHFSIYVVSANELDKEDDSNNTEPPADTEAPTDTEAPANTEAPADSDKNENPNTGVGSVAVVTGIAVVAAGAVMILGRKRK